jgi:uncharacterized membrane protein
MLKKMSRALVAGAVAVGGLLASAGAFAQASGTVINDSELVSTISSTSTTVQDVGMAVLGVVVVVFAFRLIKGFIGR